MLEKERYQLLSQLFSMANMQEQLLLQTAEESADNTNESKREQLAKQLQEMIDQYMNQLPSVAVSRCPFTGEVLTLKMDDVGIDGLWWNYDAPKRPQANVHPTFFAMDGAMSLGKSVEQFPFMCAPGPDVPSVLPRLLQYIQVKAVISSIQVGPHTAYPIIYFSQPMLEGEPRVNDWGTNRYWETGTSLPELMTPGYYVSMPSDTSEYDFDLTPWIQSGKVLWIAPDDPSMTLHGHLEGCPYINLVGNHNPKYIQNGKVWLEQWEYASEEEVDIGELMRLATQIEEGDFND